MRTRYIRDEPDRRDNLVAGAVAGALAVGVGAAAFYLVRLVLARDPVPERPAVGAELRGGDPVPSRSGGPTRGGSRG